MSVNEIMICLEMEERHFMDSNLLSVHLTASNAMTHDFVDLAGSDGGGSDGAQLRR